jgi:anti-anti-sigma factor
MIEDAVNVRQVTDHVWLVEALGEHDLANAKRFEDALQGVFDAGSRLVLDLSGARFIDSSIVRVIMSAKVRADKHQDDALVIVAPPDSLARRVLDLGEHVTILDDRSAGLAAVGVVS